MEQRSAEERREYWRGVVARWRQSGLGKAGFCRENDLRLWQFHYWVKRIAELDGPEQGFAHVAAAGSGVYLRLEGGMRLEVEPGFDESTLRRLVQALAG